MVLLISSSTLLFCVALHGPLQPDSCRQLHRPIISVSDAVAGLFGR
ncbi:MAG: hypothetical protein HYY19_07780 [Candidatus Rokubacteria bacterium]|nr:hypothetical protein [Candidatus Rokubacteria bacterium]